MSNCCQRHDLIGCLLGDRRWLKLSVENHAWEFGYRVELHSVVAQVLLWCLVHTFFMFYWPSTIFVTFFSLLFIHSVNERRRRVELVKVRPLAARTYSHTHWHSVPIILVVFIHSIEFYHNIDNNGNNELPRNVVKYKKFVVFNLCHRHRHC